MLGGVLEGVYLGVLVDMFRGWQMACWRDLGCVIGCVIGLYQMVKYLIPRLFVLQQFDDHGLVLPRRSEDMRVAVYQ